VRPSVHYDETVRFYRDVVELPVLEAFQGSYGEDGTIFGLPDSSTQLEIVRSKEPVQRIDPFDQLVFYLSDERSQQEIVTRLAASGIEPASEQHSYWQANGGVTFRDPDGRGVVFVSWVYGRDVQPASRRVSGSAP
jgi:hypothetical protein